MPWNRDTVVVITGASGGVGRATARLFGDRGAKSSCWPAAARDSAAAEQDVESRGGTALAVPTDVSQFDQVASRAEDGRSANSARSICGSTTPWCRCIARSWK